MNALERGVGVVAFLQQDDAFDDVVVVDELPVFVVDGLLAAGFVRVVHARVSCAEGSSRFGGRSGTEAAGLTDLAEANLRTLDDGGDVLDAQGSAGLGLEDGVLDVLDVLVEADLADVDLLLALLDEAAAGVGVVVGELLLDLADAETVGDELVGIDADLVLARDTAEAGDIDDAGDGLELLFELPVLRGT